MRSHMVGPIGWSVAAPGTCKPKRICRSPHRAWLLGNLPITRNRLFLFTSPSSKEGEVAILPPPLPFPQS